MKQYAGMDEYEPHPSLLALNNALDLPQREAGLDGASRAYLYEFLWEWCDRQRVSAGLSADYREHLHNNGSGAFFKYKPRTRNMADYYASKVPDVLLDEPGKPVVSVDDVWGRGAVAASTRERAWAERQPAEERVTTRVERVDCESLKSLVDIDTLGGFGGLELGLPSSPKGAHLRGRNAVPRLGRPPIEQTLARAYIDMRLVEEEMWARYPEHFAERGSADAARWA